MGAVDYSVWIRALPEDVWRVYVDPSRIPQWQTGSPLIEEVHGPADQPGQHLRLTAKPRRCAHYCQEGRQAQPPDDDDRGLFRVAIRRQVLAHTSGGRHLAGAAGRDAWPKRLGLLGKLVEAAILSPREGQKELGRLKALIESDLRA
jgi:hypothetical protein